MLVAGVGCGWGRRRVRPGADGSGGPLGEGFDPCHGGGKRPTDLLDFHAAAGGRWWRAAGLRGGSGGRGWLGSDSQDPVATPEFDEQVGLAVGTGDRRERGVPAPAGGGRSSSVEAAQEGGGGRALRPCPSGEGPGLDLVAGDVVPVRVVEGGSGVTVSGPNESYGYTSAARRLGPSSTERTSGRSSPWSISPDGIHRGRLNRPISAPRPAHVSGRKPSTRTAIATADDAKCIHMGCRSKPADLLCGSTAIRVER